MAKIYLVGGAPRLGKTTIIQELIKQKPISAVSTDAIRSVAMGLQSPEDNPRLFRVERGAFGSDQHLSIMKNQPDLALRHEILSAKETWKSVLNFIDYLQRDGKDAAIEGVAVLPSKLSEMKYDHNAVFIANLDDPTESLLEHAQKNPDDWLNKYDETTIRAYGKFNQLWNKYYADEAGKYGYKVVEIKPDDFNSGIQQATGQLLS